ncbi:hypothetical protein DRP05_08935 [Archaeoglobales archaeon]|nr:MAG: hypothetical protein DRP05_08935 [Archaeoglobales archaeon]
MIDHYSFGKIVVNGKTYTSDVIVFKDRVRDNWWRKEGHRVYLEDIEEILKAKPDIVVFGTGAYGRVVVDREVIKKLEEMGAEVIVEETSKAIKTFNKFKDKNVVLAAHLTC